MPRQGWRAGLLACALISVACAASASALPRAPTPKEAASWKSLVAQAEAARAAGNWAAFERLTRQRAAIEQATYGPLAPITAASYSWIGQALAHRGRDAEAEAFYHRALTIDRLALGEGDAQTLLATNNLAATLERLGRFAEAEPLRRRLLSASRAAFGPNGPETAAAAVALADVLRALMRPAEAEPLYRAAIEVDRKALGEAHPQTAADLGALAAALDDQGRHLEAEPLHRRALTLRRQAFGERDAATAQASARMAANLDAQGRHAEAEPLHRMALATDRDVRGTAHPATAADLAALGANLDAQGRSAEAEPLLRQALALRRGSLGETALDTGESYGALAANLARRGKPAEAERLHRKALAIATAAKGPRDPAVASAQIALAADLAARGRPDEAERLLRQALATRRAVLGETHPATAEAYGALADNQHRQAADTPAEESAARAVAIVRARRSADLRTAETDAEAALRRARAGAEAAQGPVFRRYLRLAWLAARERPSDLPRLRDAAFTAAQDLDVSPAARALAQTTARAASAHGGEARVQQELAGQARLIEGQLVQALPARDPGQSARIGIALDAVGRELAGLDARLSKDNPKYAELAAPPPLTLAQVQQRLRQGEGLLLITSTGDDVHVFAISRTKVAWNRLEGAQPGLEEAIRALRCQVDDEPCRGRGPAEALPVYDLAAAHGLYRDLVAPVEGALAGVDRLFVTASGPLGDLPLGLLPTAAPSPALAGLKALTATPWLADRYALTTLPAVASLRAMPARAAAGRRVAFLGYGEPAAGAKFAPIPGAAGELRAMARALGAPAASVRLGAQATEASLKTAPELASAGVVAFATHSVNTAPTGGLAEPALVLTPPARPGQTSDDGLLTASEAAALHLSADWVILSSCNTAGPDGAPGADNLSGLARGFLQAGARALLVSYWRVFDDATAQLTVRTLALQRANPNLTKAQALQRAMREVRTGRRSDGAPLPGWRPEWAHPAYWAPFVLIADG